MHLAALLFACSGLVSNPSLRDDTSVTDTDSAADTDTGPSVVTDPGMPTFPDTIDVLHINVRTYDEQFAGTDSNTLELCLTAVDCFSLAMPSWNDYERGATDVHIFENVDIPRSAVDRVEIHSANGDDQWRPECISMSFDGEAVYCRDEMALKFGNEGAELELWSDPLTLHLACDSQCFDENRTHGPMLGAAEPDTARVWVRTDATQRVAMRMSRNAADLTAAVPMAYAYPTAADDFTTTFAVDNLQPSSARFYDLEIAGVRHGPYTFETTRPHDTSGDLRFAFGSCSKHADQPIFESIRQQDLDLFLFVGDNHYANSNDLSALRQWYRWSLERNERPDLAREVQTIAIWDDHDFVGNNTDGYAEGKRTALRVFNEYWANPSAGTDSIEGVFFTHKIGDVEFFMLDDRYWRGFEDSLLGGPQTDWLTAALKASTATFKFVVTGSQFTSQGSSDSWAAFPAAHNAFRQMLVTENIDGVALMSGDVHRSEFRLLPGGTGGYDLPELTSSPMANTNSGCQDESEQRDCHDTDDYYMVVDVDSSGSDPSFTARILNVTGVEQSRWRVSLSDLTIP